MRISAASLTASFGVMEPFVVTSSFSLSKSVRWPTRAASTSYKTRRTGEKIESIGITPIVCSGPRFSSAGTYPRPRPIVSVSSSLPLSARLAISSSGLRISSSAGASMSPALTMPGPFFWSRTSTSGDSPCSRQIMFFRLRMMSVTSSRTPGSVVNSCATPSIFTDVTAAPSSEESSTRRSELPNVNPKPRSSGSITKIPRSSFTSSWTIFGTWNSIMRVAKTVLSLGPREAACCAVLLRVELDDQRLLHRGVDLAPVGPLENLSGQPVVVSLEPRGHRCGQVGRVAHGLLGGAAGADGAEVVRLALIARNVHATAVDGEVTVPHQLARLCARGSEAEPVDDVVEARLQHAQQVLAGD